MIDTKSKQAERERAVLQLLRAEIEFTRAYTEWMKAPPPKRAAQKDKIEAWERRIEEAMREAQRQTDGLA